MTEEEKLAKAEAAKAEAQAKWDAQPKWLKGLVKVTFGLLFFMIAVFIVVAITSPKPMPDPNKAYLAVESTIKASSYMLQSEGINDMSFPFTARHTEYLNDSTYLVVSHVNYKNNFGVSKKYNYTARIKYLGGEEYDESSWQLISLEEFDY